MYYSQKLRISVRPSRLSVGRQLDLSVALAVLRRLLNAELDRPLASRRLLGAVEQSVREFSAAMLSVNGTTVTSTASNVADISRLQLARVAFRALEECIAAAV